MSPAWPEDTVFRRLVVDVESNSCEHCNPATSFPSAHPCGRQSPRRLISYYASTYIPRKVAPHAGRRWLGSRCKDTKGN
jgi:hypothetical protein